MLERIHLEIIKRLKEEGSLTKAANKLFLTQPALTHSIKKLEGIIESRIWYKNGRDLHLTQTGEYIYKKSLELLPQFEKAETDLLAISNGNLGQLRIGVECHPCYEWLVGIIKNFLITWERVDLDVTRSFQFDGVDALLKREVDLVITPDRILNNNLTYYPVKSFELQLVMSNKHHLLSKKFIEPSDLVNETLYTYPVSKDRLDIFKSFLTPGETAPQKHIEIEDTEIILQLVASGRGVTTFPNWLLPKYTDEFNIEGRNIGSKGIKKELYMVIRNDDIGINYIKDFIKRGHE